MLRPYIAQGTGRGTSAVFFVCVARALSCGIFATMGCNSSKSSAYDASPASDGAPTLTGGEALHASEVNLRLSHGGAHSAVHTHSAEELRVHAMAEKLSKQHAHSEAKIVKLLWLGAGEWRATYDNYVSLARTGTTIHSEQERKAKGVVQTNFKIKGLDFAMFHVGSQRNGRRKWIHAFDDVNAVIFVAALSDFDQVLYEDETQNRMEQAISLFDQIVNSRWFAETSFVLLLTEKDVFEQKIKRASISKHFPDYEGARRRPNLLPTIDVRMWRARQVTTRISRRVRSSSRRSSSPSRRTSRSRSIRTSRAQPTRRTSPLCSTR